MTDLIYSYFPVVLDEFKASGLFQDVLEAGTKMTSGVAWRRPKSTTILAAIPGSEDVFAMTLGQHILSHIIVRKLSNFQHASLNFGHRLHSFQEVEGKIECRFTNTQESGNSTSTPVAKVRIINILNVQVLKYIYRSWANIWWELMEQNPLSVNNCLFPC